MNKILDKLVVECGGNLISVKLANDIVRNSKKRNLTTLNDVINNYEELSNKIIGKYSNKELCDLYNYLLKF